MTKTAMPPHIHDAFRRVCRSAILRNYIGGRVDIWPDWRETGKWGYIRIFSTSIAEDSRKGLRELRRLVKAGVLIEDERMSVQVRQFTLADKDLEQRMLTEAYEHWTALGYSTDKITEKRH